jgi:hypothetical protein
MSERRPSFTIESPRCLLGDYRIRVSEHEDRCFVGIDAGLSSHAIMLQPAQLVALAGELLAVASALIDRDFKRRAKSP